MQAYWDDDSSPHKIARRARKPAPTILPASSNPSHDQDIRKWIDSYTRDEKIQHGFFDCTWFISIMKQVWAKQFHATLCSSSEKSLFRSWYNSSRNSFPSPCVHEHLWNSWKWQVALEKSHFFNLKCRIIHFPELQLESRHVMCTCQATRCRWWESFETRGFEYIRYAPCEYQVVDV